MIPSAKPKNVAAAYWIGKRVQLPAWSDLWMRGARFGTVSKIRRSGIKLGYALLIQTDAGPRGTFNENDVTLAD